VLQQNEQNDYLEIYISSLGGEYTELLDFYNTINTNYNYVTTFLNYGYSAGALAFLFGQERIVYEHSEWMIHSYSTGVGGKREDMLNHVNFMDKQILKFFDTLLAPYFSKKEINKINKGKDFWLDSDEMLKRGIATGILKNGEYTSREDYINPKKKKTKEKKAKKEKKSKNE
jgi:ATP-dependent protease ClpP protease subunit